MSEELKSAWELALEKLRARGQADETPLTERQKQAIAEVRRTFRNRRAEAKVLHEQAVRKALEKGDPEKLALLREEHERELARLDELEQEKVNEIRERVDR
ncbi:MAG: hypothetical protein Kow0062_15440 [Acidobacteriota bacterium]|nr:MAG: hypothetical protein D6738_15205 [Acidobacteriota bacterium]